MSDAAFLCSVGSSGANQEVLQHFQSLDALTNKYEGLVNGLVQSITGFQLPNLTTTVQTPDILNYALTAPTDITGLDAIDPNKDIGTIPVPMPFLPMAPVVLDAQPQAPGNPADPSFGAEPSVYNPAFPSQSTLQAVTTPTFGDRTQGIQRPQLRQIILPTAPTLNWNINFNDLTLPLFTAVPPDPKEFAFTPDAYTPTILPAVQSVLQQMFAGQTGIPPQVENAIWMRGAERENEVANRSIQTALRSWASLGFTIPNGILNSSRDEALRDAQDKSVSISRDVMIQKFQEQVEIIKFAVTQGIACENVYVQIYIAVQGMRLEAAKFAVNIALSIFNAYVSKFQAEISFVSIQLEAKKAAIQVNLGILQGYRDQLEADRIIGTLNQQDIDLYNSALNAVMTDARIYETEVQAAGLVIQENLQTLQQQRMIIDEELAKLNASEIQSRIYSTSVQKEVTKQQAYSTRAQVFSSQMGAWSTAQNVKIENERLVSQLNNTIVNQFGVQVQAFNTKATYVRTLTELIVQSNNSKVSAYSAKQNAFAAYNTVLVEKSRAATAAAQQNVEIALKNGEINIQNLLEGERIKEQLLTTAVQVYSQILSSALSGHSTHAQLSDSSSYGYGCNYSTTQDLTP